MTNMVYGHMPPFGLVTNEQERHDMNIAMQKAKEDFREKCNTMHQTVVDMVNKPPHYTSGNIECIDYIHDVLTKEEFIGYLRGCMIKYQHRLRYKDTPSKNAAKMEWYAKKLSEALECN